MDQKELVNRLLIATTLWRRTTGDPLPRLPPGDPAHQLETFELQLVERLCREATAASAREVADMTWDLVHDRPASDPVKRRVIECHEELARLSHRTA